MPSPNERYDGSLSDISAVAQNESDIGWPSTGEVRNRLKKKRHSAMSDAEYVLINAVTSSGKSTNGAKTEWSELSVTGNEPVIHLHGTKDARKDAIKKSKQAGVDYHVLKSRKEACKTAKGDYDHKVDTPDDSPASDWITRHCGKESGVSFSSAHDYLKEHNGGDLPCCTCESKTQYDHIPRDENENPVVDVIHATHQFAFVPSIINNTNIIIDEQPNFSKSVGANGDLSQMEIQDMVSAWLNKINCTITTWELFVITARDGHSGLEECITQDYDVDRDWFIETSEAHTLAPTITKAIYYALSGSPDDNGLYSNTRSHTPPQGDIHKNGSIGVPNLPPTPKYEQADSGSVETRLTVVIDDNNRVQAIWNVPEFDNARSVICLDAWPSLHEFYQNVGENLSLVQLMDSEERKKWRRFERGLEVAQIGDYARPMASDHAYKKYFNHDELEIIVESLRLKFGEDFRSAIAPKKIKDDITEAMEEVGINNPDSWFVNMGAEKSFNEFSKELVGFVTNCIDPGDDYVRNLLAAQNLDATPETKECAVCNGEGCRVCNESGEKRARGRGFTGSDSDEAEEILAGIRSNHVNQSVGRYARKPDDEDIRSMCFVRSSCVDDSLVDVKLPDPWVFGKKQGAAVDFLRDNPKTTLKNTAEAIEDQFDDGVTKESIRNTFEKCIDHNVAEKSEGTGAYGADEYKLIEPVPELGVMKFPER